MLLRKAQCSTDAWILVNKTVDANHVCTDAPWWRSPIRAVGSAAVPIGVALVLHYGFGIG